MAASIVSSRVAVASVVTSVRESGAQVSAVKSAVIVTSGAPPLDRYTLKIVEPG